MTVWKATGTQGHFQKPVCTDTEFCALSFEAEARMVPGLPGDLIGKIWLCIIYRKAVFGIWWIPLACLRKSKRRTMLTDTKFP